MKKSHILILAGLLLGSVSFASYSSMASNHRAADRLKTCEKRLGADIITRDWAYEENLWYMNAMQALYACMQIEKMLDSE